MLQLFMEMLFNRTFLSCKTLLSRLFASTRAMATATTDGVLLDMIRSIVPPLGPKLYKGQCGRIAVIGGSKEYTGAPYFAAISAMKVGADLSYVICTNSAAPVIKSYSPELIVHPVLDEENAVDKIADLLPRMHSVVIGPGLGRDVVILQTVKHVMEKVCSLQLPLVIDADGVYLLSQDPNIIQGCTTAILTPNSVEFGRLYEAVFKGEKSTGQPDEVTKLSSALGGVTIVRKGEADIIANDKQMLMCKAEGSWRRCGGQGDLLSGSMGVFCHWAHHAARQKLLNKEAELYGPCVTAAYAACYLTRECARRAFARTQRSTTTSDLIASINDVFSTQLEPSRL